jgi:OOP family OmpA-OmpF porin
MIRKLNTLLVNVFIVAALQLPAHALFGQYNPSDFENQSLREVRSTAKNAFRLGDTYTALAYFEEWSNRSSDDLRLLEKTADLYRITRNYKKAEEWYLKLLERDASSFPMSYFYLGEVQMGLEKYTEAKKNYLEFKTFSREINDPQFRKLLKYKIPSCEYAIRLKDSTNKSLSAHLGNTINFPHIEFSPISLNHKTMIYGSFREKNLNLYETAKTDSVRLPVRKLYVAAKEGDEWVAKGELEGPFNQQAKNIGNAVISADGNRMYFTYCEKNWQNRMICNLFLSEKEEENWSEPIKLNDEINLPNFTTTQPAIGRASKSNQEVLYFVSDRPGGKGGLDVWYTEFHKRRNKFKSPRNAGSKINSVGTECTPFYDISSHKLYFSSDGQIGLGGLDVYSADGEKSKWEEPKNMEATINSSADDLDFTLHQSKKGGFVVSNRKGGAALLSETCCDDIYEFVFSEYVSIALQANVMVKEDCLKNYKVNVFIKEKDSEDKYLAQSYTVDTCGFKINLDEGKEYSVEIEKDGYFTSVNKFDTKTVKESKVYSSNILVEEIPSKPIQLTDILYEFNSPEVTKEAKAAIDSTLYRILVENPQIKIRIVSHTDSKGTEAYNLSLSEKRATSVIKYLISKGVRKDRLEAKGYGESKPIAENTKADGSDNPEGRKLNRRTELEIIGQLSQDELDEGNED